jgi:flavin-dependent dehydrogenase
MSSNLTRDPSNATDVLVVGGGPAGLACAIASAKRGLRVEVIDGVRPPIDKACGEGLMPDSLEALAAIGITNLDFSGCDNHQLRGIRFIGDQPDSSSSARIEAAFPDIPGRGIQRTVLHQLLLDRAASLGVRFHWQNSLRSIIKTNQGIQLLTNRQTLNARYLVGADGPGSRVAAWAGLTEASVHSRRIGLRQHYIIAPWTDFVEVYWSDYGQAYVTPTSSNRICVAFISNRKIFSPDEALIHFPALRHHLTAATPSGPSRGSITLGRRLRRVTAKNIALIGDASGSVDAVTGEGLALCFRQATALSQALQIEDLSLYEKEHRRIQRLPSLMSRSLLLMDHYPLLRTQILSLFQHHPKLFSLLLNLHIGHNARPLSFRSNSSFRSASQPRKA